MAHFDIIITLQRFLFDILENIFLMFLKQYFVCWAQPLNQSFSDTFQSEMF